MGTHHLILGTLTDFLSGREIPDTHDERYKQKIARILVLEKNFVPSDITAGKKIQVSVPGKNAAVTIDFLVYINGIALMLVRYGPGSVVTRHRPALAVSRLVAPYQVPVVVVTNGEDVDVLDGFTGRVKASGFDAVPDRKTLEAAAEKPLQNVGPERISAESRILFAFDVDGSCFCDRGNNGS